MGDKPHYDVLIATPGKLLHAEYVESLVNTIRWMETKGLSYKFLNKQSSFIPSGRELVATDSYDFNWDSKEVGSGAYTYGKIFWIDSDIEWSVEDFARILASPFDVLGGMYATAPDGTVAVARFDEKRRPKKTNEVDFFMNEEMTEVFGLGFGFIAMKSGVFESMDRPWFKIEQMQWDELTFTVNVGEDYSWCMNARRNGYKIWVDPGVKVKHHKETIYYLP